MSNKKTPFKNSSKRRAFSLIELSIVLIIIGLLIAGITGGASLIKSASLRAAMGEARGYNVAVNSFYVQFDSLPGDSATAILASGTASATNPNSVPGDANSRIEYIDGGNSTATAGTGNVIEAANAWAALKNAGVIDTILTYSAPTVGAFTMLCNACTLVAQTPGVNLPSSKMKASGWTFDYVGTQNVAILTGAIAVLGSAHTNQTNGTAQNAIPTGAITPSDALSIDTKMDDGVANSGRVRGASTLATPANCFSTTTYTTSRTTTDCALTFQVDIT